ncbi:DUF4381 domain-containing protein [Caldichromatium japonicum]|uniref:DUF4381 domain-containing protein n=1 Tax=Caldichromatium japonicum TaxID=2699430 RepID=A0A6G7VDD4_9GAMM|nr:DUF4381 domain-containing protein [Caldichromatium japonicum]QIK38083.1 DUF4381 domain-containing protein [Caldichromatium japonicum]
MDPELLAELRDWHLPEAPSWWPPAPGWWALLGLALLAAAALGLWSWRRQRARDPRRAARFELVRLRQALAADGDRRGHLAALSRLVRRVALAYYPPDQVAGLNGEAWLDFLDRTGGDGAFGRGVGRALVDAAHRPAPDGVDLDALHALIAQWIARQPARMGHIVHP